MRNIYDLLPPELQRLSRLKSFLPPDDDHWRLSSGQKSGLSDGLGAGYGRGGRNWGAAGTSASTTSKKPFIEPEPVPPKTPFIEPEPVPQKKPFIEPEPVPQKKPNPGVVVQTIPVKGAERPQPSMATGHSNRNDTVRPPKPSKPSKPKLNGSVVQASECNENECCVCRKKFARRNAMVALDCGHVMHRECCCSQIMKYNFCPKCYVPIVSSP